MENPPQIVGQVAGLPCPGPLVIVSFPPHALIGLMRPWRATALADVFVEGLLLAELVVVGLGEAVGLVAHLLEKA